MSMHIDFQKGDQAINRFKKWTKVNDWKYGEIIDKEQMKSWTVVKIRQKRNQITPETLKIVMNTENISKTLHKKGDVFKHTTHKTVNIIYFWVPAGTMLSFVTSRNDSIRHSTTAIPAPARHTPIPEACDQLNRVWRKIIHYLVQYITGT